MESPAIIIDNGSGTMKAGISGTSLPISFPTLTGYPLTKNIMLSHNQSPFIGDSALKKRAVLTLSHPIQRASIQNWEEMEQIWQFCFY